MKRLFWTIWRAGRDAAETLAEFMVDGEPDWELFRRTVDRAIQGVRPAAGGIRAYGEMVGIV